jgi:hypothetical protein
VQAEQLDHEQEPGKLRTPAAATRAGLPGRLNSIAAPPLFENQRFSSNARHRDETFEKAATGVHQLELGESRRATGGQTGFLQFA